MSKIAKVKSISLSGLQGSLVIVEAGAGRQLPGMGIVGLPDTALSEAKQRVKHAASSAGLSLTEKFVLINLQPADLPKHGSGFDLAIALAALASLGKVDVNNGKNIVHLGELGLDGSLRRPRGLLAAVVAAKRLGFNQVMVPREASVEADLVPGMRVLSVGSLAEAVAWYQGKVVENFVFKSRNSSSEKAAQNDTEKNIVSVDVSDVIGQKEAVEALEVAAAGKHHMHMEGPPGAGKTLLASALQSVLPDLTSEESISVTSIAALSSDTPIKNLITRPPFENPHHTATAPSIIGSGQGTFIKPGAISLASNGVLFLDEAQEFPSRVLDALRQPLEKGIVEIHRAAIRATLPAKVQLILASNPCPCGNAGSVKTVSQCFCSHAQLRRYKAKISGPLKDRLDLRLFVDRVGSLEQEETPVTSIELKKRVIAARKVAAERLHTFGFEVNSQVPGSLLRSHFHPGSKNTLIIDKALEIGRITLRGYDRVLRLAWTKADLAGKSSPGREEISAALVLREGTMSH